MLTYRISDATIRRKFQTIMRVAVPEALNLAYSHTLMGASLGLDDLVDWSSISREKRGQIGITGELALKNLTAFDYADPSTGLDLTYRGTNFDVKFRDHYKDVSFSEKQNDALALIVRYDVSSLRYWAYMGYPSDYGTSYCPSNGKYSLSKGACTAMPLLAAGHFA